MGGYHTYIHRGMQVIGYLSVLTDEYKKHDRNIIHESAGECHETMGEAMVMLSSADVIRV